VHIDNPPDGPPASGTLNVTVSATANSAQEQVHCDLWQLGMSSPVTSLQQQVANPPANTFAFNSVPLATCMIRAYLDSDHNVAHSITINFP
jgi:hypothetical protein